MTEKLENKTAVVTGAGKGIGRAIALALAKNGASVVCSDKDFESAHETMELCGGGKHLAVETDVKFENSICSLFKTVAEKYSRIDIAVSNAGVFKPTPILDLSAEEWDFVMSVNLRGTFLFCREAFKMMKGQGAGKIINIASTAGKTAGANNGAHYATSKAGVICFTKSLARQAAPFNLNVNAVCPGPTETDLTAKWDDNARDAVLKLIPLNRFLLPEDTAYAVLFLASESANNITGEVLDVNGGMIMD